MSAVNVLAVMDYHEGLFRKQVGTPLNELAEARAAVAELIEIVEALSNTVDEDGDSANGTHYVDNGRIRCKGSYLTLVARADAALARCKGEGQ